MKKKTNERKTTKRKPAKRKSSKSTLRKRKNPIRRKNPTEFEKDLELYDVLHAINVPVGFHFHIYDFDKIIHIEPTIPEWPEWGKLYPVLTFPFDINKNLPTDILLIKVAQILARGIIPGNIAALPVAKRYLFNLKLGFTSNDKMQALGYLRKYHALKKIYPEGHRKVY